MTKPPRRVLRLRYPAKCAVCFRALKPGTRAEWNSVRKVAICLPCTAARPGTDLLASVAVASARTEAARRRARQQARLDAEREARPLLGRLRQGLFPEPDAGASYEKGGAGEEAFARSLTPLVEAGTVVALHDRRIPGSRANIDHLVVAANGVWVVDAKHYRGRIRSDVRGGFFSARSVVTVGGRDRSALLGGVEKQLDVVQCALAAAELDAIPLQGALCFVGGDWGFRLRPFRIRGVLVTWPKALRSRLAEAGALDSDQRRRVAAALADALPPAS